MKGKIAIYIMIAIMLLPAMGIMVQGAETEQTTPTLVERGIIDIWTDSDFTLANGVSNGTGTEQDPYIIENWLINGTGTADYSGIIIDTTDAYCIIRNCEIIGFREEELSAGINIYSSSNVIIEDCYVYDNNIGITMWDAVNIKVDNCYLEENGYIDTGGGIGIWTGIQVLSSSYVTISNNQLYNEQTVGIRMYRSINCTVEYNYIYNAIQSGIKSDGMTYSTFQGNYIIGCLNGFYGKGQLIDDKMEYCLIINNTFINNIEKGVFMLDTENNTFYYNNFINNGVNVVEFNNDLYNGGVYTNIWYNINTNEGNYYDDYTGEDILKPLGVGDTQQDIFDEFSVYSTNDPYPLMEIYTGVEDVEEAEPLTFGEIITTILIGIFPVIIIILILKYIFGLFTNIGDTGKSNKGD